VQMRQAHREQPESGQVEIRIEAIGICGTDLHIMSGHANFSSPPLPLGHELAGYVVRIGERVTGWSIGDRVCVDPLISCGHCEPCRAGQKHRCLDAGEIGLHYPGGWQQYLNVPASNLYQLPDSVSFEEASQAETLHCCLGGIDKLSIRLGMRATVMGDGPTGLFYVQLLKAAGLNRITLIGMNEKRLSLGQTFGADQCVNIRSTDLNTLQLMNTQDIVIDAAGVEASLQASIDVLKPGGQLLLFGLPEKPFPVDIHTIVMKELTLLGSTNAPDVWPRVIDMLANNTVNVKALITHRFEFDQLNEAVDYARLHPSEAIKIIVSNKHNEEEVH